MTPTPSMNRATSLLLNFGHALDHLFLLIFATAVLQMAASFRVGRWEDLMPYGTGAFLMFGLGSVLAGKLGDQWGRRNMMLVFFAGMGVSSLLVSLTQTTWQLAAALTLLGAFSSIYHPVGIPMLLQNTSTPGKVIGINGLAGNLGIALAAILTGLLVKYFGWRTAFVVPGVVSLLLCLVFHKVAPLETSSPSKRISKHIDIPPKVLAKVFLIMTLAATSASLIFNFTTNGNTQLLQSRIGPLGQDPAVLGLLMGAVYAIASVSQLIVGHLIDRYPLKTIWLSVVFCQIPLFALAAIADGWAFFAIQVLFMAVVFGAIPFTDAVVVRFIDDRMRSRVSGMRLTISYTASSIAVWLLGPLVKLTGFGTLLLAMSGIALITFLFVTQLPQPAHTIHHN
jgi:MFS family permease